MRISRVVLSRTRNTHSSVRILRVVLGRTRNTHSSVHISRLVLSRTRNTHSSVPIPHVVLSRTRNTHSSVRIPRVVPGRTRNTHSSVRISRVVMIFTDRQRLVHIIRRPVRLDTSRGIVTIIVSFAKTHYCSTRGLIYLLEVPAKQEAVGLWYFAKRNEAKHQRNPSETPAKPQRNAAKLEPTEPP